MGISKVEVDGITLLREAREKAKLSSYKKLEAGVLDHILFSSELAASGIDDLKTRPRSDIYLKSLIESGIESSYIPDTVLRNYDINFFSGTIDSILPMMKLGDEKVDLTGSALFHKDKMVGSINILSIYH